ncbi:MAG: NAD-dependent epimerase/dehydratase family protein [Thermoplasmatales archaeon]|nr:MAG: NAD-dependent epimerase/dehydratase family protein [Thermoplasmatales archaeon]
MNIFVTGGAGFIGSHLVDRLINERNTVTVYDNLSSGKKQFIEHHLQKDNFTFIEADLLDLENVTKKIKDHDVVFHIAANPDVKLGAQQPDIAKRDILATYNLLDAMRMSDIKKIVFSSSSTIYGETPEFPLPESYGPLLPISVYGAAKLAAEGLISSFCHTFDMQGWIFRFANVVGERGTHGVIVDFINKLRISPNKLEILGDGRQRKPYLYVEDCVGGMYFGFEHSNEQINIFNLGCNTATEVTRIAEIVVEEMGLNNVKFTYTGGKRGWKGDVPQFQFDISKMKKLGWKATVTSDEAVRKTTRILLDTNI